MANSLFCVKKQFFVSKNNKKKNNSTLALLYKTADFYELFFVCLNKLWMANKHTNIFSLTKQKKTHQLKKQTHGCQEEGIVKGFGKVMYTLLYFKRITT